jgi:O-methyltransferase/methyltransferase family protein
VSAPELPAIEPLAPIPIANPDVPAVALFQLLLGAYTTQLLYVTAELRLADALAGGPATAGELAERVGADAPSLGRFCRSLTGIGVLRSAGGGRFELTAMGELLREDVPGSMRAGALYQGSPWHWQAFGALAERVRTGTPSFELVHGAPFYDWLAVNPDASAVFNDAMRAFAAQSHLVAVAAYDFGDVRRVTDVAGGTGTLLAGILAMHPHLHGTLFDQPAAADGARRTFAEAGLEQRTAVVEGDFFAAVPAGGDCYLLSMILIDLDDEAAIALLERIAAAMQPGSRLLVLEMLLEEDDEPSFAKLGDLDVLVTTRGATRTRQQLQSLFTSAGFGPMTVHPSLSPVHCLEVRPGRG